MARRETRRVDQISPAAVGGARVYRYAGNMIICVGGWAGAGAGVGRGRSGQGVGRGRIPAAPLWRRACSTSGRKTPPVFVSSRPRRQGASVESAAKRLGSHAGRGFLIWPRKTHSLRIGTCLFRCCPRPAEQRGPSSRCGHFLLPHRSTFARFSRPTTVRKRKNPSRGADKPASGQRCYSLAFPRTISSTTGYDRTSVPHREQSGVRVGAEI